MAKILLGSRWSLHRRSRIRGNRNISRGNNVRRRSVNRCYDSCIRSNKVGATGATTEVAGIREAVTGARAAEGTEATAGTEDVEEGTEDVEEGTEDVEEGTETVEDDGTETVEAAVPDDAVFVWASEILRQAKTVARRIKVRNSQTTAMFCFLTEGFVSIWVCV
jgi:hypothetical protein